MKSEQTRARALRRQLTATFYRKNKATFFVTAGAMLLLGGALLAGISGLLKSYCNVNEVISGIMLNWIVLYLTNMLLTLVKEDASPYTKVLANTNASAVLPSLGLGALFNKNQYVGLAIPLAVVMAVIVWIVLDKTKFG